MGRREDPEPTLIPTSLPPRAWPSLPSQYTPAAAPGPCNLSKGLRSHSWSSSATALPHRPGSPALQSESSELAGDGAPEPPAHRPPAPTHSGSLCTHSSLLASLNCCSLEKKSSDSPLTGELLSRDPDVGKAQGAAVQPGHTQGTHRAHAGHRGQG